MPVGKVSANSASIELVSYEDTRKIVTYDKTNDNVDSSKIYLYKQMESKAIYKIIQFWRSPIRLIRSI
jgi:hypothetical protein